MTGDNDHRLRHCQKMESLGVLAGNVAHDLNNLFFVVLGNAELALQELPAEARATRSIRKIVDAATRASALTQEVLAYAGRGGSVVERMDLSEVVGDLSCILASTVSKHAILRTFPDDDLPLIDADNAEVRQVIVNLVTNASEALGGAGGVVSVATGSMSCSRAYLDQAYGGAGLPPGTYVYVEVTDDGCGMTEEARRHLCEPFFTTKATGRGLGLTAVRSILTQRQGALSLKSEPGRGTSMRALFPTSVQTTSCRPVKVKEDQIMQSPGVVLLVDDEDAVRMVGQQFLEMAGFEVLSASDGAEAVDIYRRRADEIQAVILDLTMPNMNGDECFRHIKEIRPDVCALLSSGFDNRELTRRYGSIGFAGFIHKPYRGTDLIEKLSQAMGMTTPPVQAEASAILAPLPPAADAQESPSEQAER